MFHVQCVPDKRVLSLGAALLVMLTVGACAGQTLPATPTSAAASGGPIIQTLPPLTLIAGPSGTPVPGVTSAPTLTNMPNDTPIGNIGSLNSGSGGQLSGPTSPPNPTSIALNATMNPPMTITSSGPTVESKVANAQAFNKAVPRTVGPFHRSDAPSAASQFGSTILYQMEDGTSYQVVVWITKSAQEAYQHYAVATITTVGQQPIKVGDEGVIFASGTLIAEVRYRNIAMDVYRPPANGTVPHTLPTDDQVIALINALLKSLPTG